MLTRPEPPANARLVEPALFSEDARRLRSSICRRCHHLAFPAQSTCARCTGLDVERTDLERRGRLWGFTIQRFVPKAPYLNAGRLDAAPYGVGYVVLAEVRRRSTILVESRLQMADVDDLAIGIELELVFEPLPSGGDSDVWTFAFAPASRSPQEASA